MPQRYPPLSARCPHLWHGGDYNPDQWQAYPEVLAEDVRLMRLAGINSASLAIFAWSALEPEEGRYTWGWLDETIDRLYANGVYTILATPSGARPAWLAQRYPEVLRVSAARVKDRFGGRHNHCFTSPVYRQHVQRINRALAERYGRHPAVTLWHVSNEYGGECHCPLCQEAFRAWLQRRYGTLEALNHAWWTSFWSYPFSDWQQIESPGAWELRHLHGLVLDWKRFVTDQTVDFFRAEIAPLKEVTPHLPVTTNFMGTYQGLNYWRFAPHLDVVCWDSYPLWGGAEPDWCLAADIAFHHDLNRCIKGGRPFLLMESTPSMTNWQVVSKPKRPGMHLLTSLLAVAHGSDSVQYFQWRKGRGGSEKFHGAVVDHAGHEHTRVFRDVAEVGQTLAKLDDIVGTTTPAEVALIYDWENAWAIGEAQGPRREGRDYLPTCLQHYRAFWTQGVPVDVIDMEQDFSRYKLLVAPMLYMVREGVGERIAAFVRAGGTFVATYWSGIVNDSDLCYTGGFPGPLREVLGIWSEELDAIYDHERNHLVPVADNDLGLRREYELRQFCDLCHAETAEVLATYRDDFYAGRPALTRNRYGQGQAYYLAARPEYRLLQDLALRWIDGLALHRALHCDLPTGLTAQVRSDGQRDFVFLLNFTAFAKTLQLDNQPYTDMLTRQPVSGTVEVPGTGLRILERPR